MKNIMGTGDKYKITKEGRVWTCKSKKFLSLCIGTDGYVMIPLRVDGIQKRLTIHRAVAVAFIANPLNKKEVNHIDGDKTNNCVDNLEWVTRQENMNHAVKHHLLVPRGKDKKKRKSRKEYRQG